MSNADLEQTQCQLTNMRSRGSRPLLEFFIKDEQWNT